MLSQAGKVKSEGTEVREEEEEVAAKNSAERETGRGGRERERE